MRIERDQLIAGLPARDVRRFFREAAGFVVRVRTVTEVLGCSRRRAVELLKNLENEGLLAATEDFWEATEKGHALAMATAAQPLRRETAERLIADLMARTRTLNADNNWPYRIRKIVVFGSYVRGVERPNDVDIACELLPRWTGSEQLVREQLRRQTRKQPFRNLTEWAIWPRLEVFRFLKTRARGLSIHELEDWIIESTDHRVLFEEETEITSR